MIRKALIVGIDDYLEAPLSGCCNDAETMGKILSRNEDGNLNFEVSVNCNVQTKSELMSLIKECFNGNSDIALFYYSGHGHIDELGGYLITPDYKLDDWGVSLHDVLTIANKSECKDKIIILDSCYSGYMGNTPRDQDTSVIGNGVTILSSSRSCEPSMEELGHGVFTSLLCEALSGSAADITGHITPGGIYAYIDKAMGAWGQRPVFKTNVTRFISLRDVKPPVELSVIRRICDYFKNADEDLKLDPSFEFTNSPKEKHELIEPYANDENVKIFTDLQKMEGVGLVIPVGEDHMYFAAMKSKSCKLTTLGKQYWKLVNKGRI